MPKFDVAIMNPPYTSGLHLKILNKTVNHSSETIYIGPINNWQKSIINKENFSIPVTEIKSVDNVPDIFDIAIRIDCGIVKIDNNKSDKYENFEHIVKKLILKRKFIKFNNINYINFLEKSPNEFSLRMFVGCNRDESHNWTVCPKTKDAAYKKQLSGHINFLNFNSIEELNNAYDFMSSSLIRAICEITSGSFTPFMQDYSKPWTNERFCKYFNITGFISDTEAEPGSEWEEILLKINI